MDGEYLRLYQLAKRAETMSEDEVNAYYAAAEMEALRPSRSQTLRYTPDLRRVPSPKVSEALDSESGVNEASIDMQAKVKQLLGFIKSYYGPRCADAAKAIMSGAVSCKEIGGKMGVCRHTAIGHVRNLQSLAVQQKAIELGLVTRDSFIQTVIKPATRRRRK